MVKKRINSIVGGKFGDVMDNDEAVSAIIGVILIVAITVVLAAVIAVFSFDIGTSMPKNKNIYVELHRINDSTVYVQTLAGDNIHNLIFDAPGDPNGDSGECGTGFYGVYNVTVNGVEVSNYVPAGSPNCTSRVGSMQYFSPVPDDSQIDVIANFKDGSKAVCLSFVV
jgi:flagellin-like protein